MEPPADDVMVAANDTNDWNRSLARLIALTPIDALARATAPSPAAKFTSAIVEAVTEEVSAYAGHTGSLSASANLSSTLLEIAADIAEAPELHGDWTATTIAQRLRDFGFVETHREIPLEDLDRVATVAVRQLWRAYRRIAADRGWGPDLLGELGETLLILRQHIDRLIADGQQSAGPRDQSSDRTRDHLIRALLRDSDLNPMRWLDLAAYCDAAQWELPERLVVIRLHHDAARLAPLVHESVLVDHASTPGRLIMPATRAAETAQRLTRKIANARLAISTPVAASDCANGDRWARRALDLVDSGVLAPAPATWCDDHTALLWLHAEPEIRRRLVQDFLGPLLDEGPTTRLVLAETMLAWLTTRDSAPIIAERLDVHAQTVRYRWRRLAHLFGDQLRDPEFTGMVTLLLRATLPLWRSGDAEDLETYRSGRPTHSKKASGSGAGEPGPDARSSVDS